MKAESKKSKGKLKLTNRQKAQAVMSGRRTKCVCAVCGLVVDYEPEFQLGRLKYCGACFDFIRDYWSNRRRD